MNVSIVGEATRETYSAAIINFTDPENLKVFIPPNMPDDLILALEQLNVDYEYLNEENDIELNRIIIFTKTMNLREVTVIREALKQNVTIITIP